MMTWTLSSSLPGKRAMRRRPSSSSNCEDPGDGLVCAKAIAGTELVARFDAPIEQESALRVQVQLDCKVEYPNGVPFLPFEVAVQAFRFNAAGEPMINHPTKFFLPISAPCRTGDGSIDVDQVVDFSAPTEAMRGPSLGPVRGAVVRWRAIVETDTQPRPDLHRSDDSRRDHRCAGRGAGCARSLHLRLRQGLLVPEHRSGRLRQLPHHAAAVRHGVAIAVVGLLDPLLEPLLRQVALDAAGDTPMASPLPAVVGLLAAGCDDQTRTEGWSMQGVGHSPIQDVQGELVRRTYWAASFKVSQAPSPDAKRAGGVSQRSLGAIW